MNFCTKFLPFEYCNYRLNTFGTLRIRSGRRPSILCPRKTQRRRLFLFLIYTGLRCEGSTGVRPANSVLIRDLTDFFSECSSFCNCRTSAHLLSSCRLSAWLSSLSLINSVLSNSICRCCAWFSARSFINSDSKNKFL